MFIFARIMKRMIAVFFLVIISIQCLPVRALGKCIFESSFVEEDLCNNSLDKKEFKDFAKVLFANDFNIESFVSSSAVYSKEGIALYKNPIADLSIQPPIS